MRPSRRTLFALLLTASAVHALPVRGGESCNPTSVGIALSQANSSGGTLLDAVGQTFVTKETHLTSLTLWGVTGGITYNQVRAVLVATDENGVPAGPALWEGLPQALPGTGPKTFTWTMDPPVVLRNVGRYAWFVCSSILDLMMVQDGAGYADGQAWETCRGACGASCLSPVDADFAFEVTFCTDATTPARRNTWGRLKSIYR